MRFRGTWILLILAVLFAGYFFLIEQPGHKRMKKEEELSQRLTELKKANIKRMTVESPGSKRMEFEKKGDSWIMLSPVVDIADDANVNVLVTSIVDAEIERRLEPGEGSLDGFGLDDAAAIVTLATEKGDSTLTLRVGNHNLTKSHFYAIVDTSQEVLLLPATIRRYAIKEIKEFRNKKIIDFKIDEVRTLDLSSSSSSLTWERIPGSDWFSIQTGDTIKGDKFNIESILRQLRGLRAKDFISDNPDDFLELVKQDASSISIWTGDDLSKKVLSCGGKENGTCYAKRESKNRIVTIDASFLDIFDKTITDLRYAKLLTFDRNDLYKIALETSDTSATILKQGTDWTFPNPALGTIEQFKVSSLISRLENLKFKEVVEEHLSNKPGFGLAEPAFKVSLFGVDNRLVDEVICGKHYRDDGSRYATSNSSGLLAVVEQKSLEEILTTFKEIKKE